MRTSATSSLFLRSAGRDEIVVDLAGTKDDLAHAGGIERIADRLPERAAGQLAEARNGSRGAQQALGREDHERLWRRCVI